MDPHTAFVFFGDSGTGEPAQYAVAAAIDTWCTTHRCDFAALLGDVIYPGGVEDQDDPQLQEKFEAPYHDSELVYHIVLGNHDHLGSVDGALRYHSPRWSLPARYYAYHAGPADFFVIDTHQFDPAQRRWLARELAASGAPWKIVLGHHPIPVHGRSGGTKALDRTLLPILRGASLYLVGHEHNKQVLSMAPPMVVVGSGGAKLTPPRTGADTVFAAKTYGFGWLDVTPTAATLALVDAQGTVEFSTVFHHPWDGRVVEGHPQRGPP